jgi:hypothetical protein
LPERNDADQALYADNFAELLLASVNSPELLLKKRDLRMFPKWLDVDLVEMVFDAGDG